MKSECCGKDVEMARMGKGHAYKFCSECNEKCDGINESFEELLERKRDKNLPSFVNPNSVWWVIYEARYT